MELRPEDKAALNELAGFLSYKPTLPFRWLLRSDSQITAMFTGNQYGKTAGVAFQYVLRLLGRHPIEHKNIRPTDEVRTFRFASETLPADDTSEVKNTQYPAFKKWLPASLIKKDITIRKPVMTIKDVQGGPDIYVEFVSFNQDTQAMAGVQRKSIWVDENCGQGFYEEQLPRLLAANGDLIMTYTPTPGSSGWEFDSLYERASRVFRTPAVRKRIYKRTGVKMPDCEIREGGEDITVIMAATDDNPVLQPEAIHALFNMFDDEDVVDARRFGLFRQLSGKIFKDFCKTHVIGYRQYFNQGVPHDWMHARGIDYHQHVPWACVWMAVSPQDEIFVWDEFNPPPDRLVTLDIATRMAEKSGDHRFRVNLIDPLAAQKQVNTGFSTIDDLNRIFSQLKKEGLCTGGYWESWDTKSTSGRDEVRKRLKNSILVGKPFNNVMIKDHRKTLLPTLWITDNCVNTINSMKNWRWDEWANRDANLIKDDKDTPIQRWSHFCMAVECLLKDPRVFRAKFRPHESYQRAPKSYYRAYGA